MKKIAVIMILALGAYLAPAALAQNHGEAGVYADYVRLESLDTNNFGLGVRGSFNIHPKVQVEGEMSYDFARNFSERFTLGGTGPGAGTVRFTKTGLRLLHGLFGAKFQTGGQAIRAFATIKGGFVNFRFDNRPVTFATFTSSVQSLRSDDVRGAFYPGGGVEFFAGIIGIRAEVGDLIYFRDGAFNNLRVAVGPTIRF